MIADRDETRRREAAQNFFQHGRMALQEGDRERGKQLLLLAVECDRGHSDAWLWLSAATDDLHEQKQYLEWAIAADPANAAAKRGLGIVLGKINPEHLAPNGYTPEPQVAEEPAPAEVEQTFTCPQCGAALNFDPKLVDLRCDHCGHVEVVEEKPAAGQEQVLDFALATVQAHHWAVGERRFTCEQCGASTVLPEAEKSSQCPFCGSPALVRAAEEADLLQPQAVIPMGEGREVVGPALQRWLGRGFWVPDDLALLARGHRLRPVYVPFWCFNATVTAHWKARVAEGSGRSRHWEWRTGDDTFFYTNLLIPGIKSLPADLLRHVQPFDMDKAVEYQPAYLAGWPASTYDVPLTDASLDARSIMIKASKRRLVRKIGASGNVTDLEVARGDFTGQSYQLVLLPVWIGSYHYQGRPYRVVVNGQTLKVVGDKPVDWVKVVLVGMAALIALVPLVALAIYFRP